MNDDPVRVAYLESSRLSLADLALIADAMQGSLSDAMRDTFLEMEVTLGKATVWLAEFADDAPTPRPQPHTMRDALAANARPVHRPQPQRRIQRRQHR